MSVLALASIYALPANAVHDDGAFELDGNADLSVPAGSPPAAEDWSLICKAKPAQFDATGRVYLRAQPRARWHHQGGPEHVRNGCLE